MYNEKDIIVTDEIALIQEKLTKMPKVKILVHIRFEREHCFNFPDTKKKRNNTINAKFTRNI